ncbi:hypothetical protein R1flu_014439 [Riccia fluitans]|uniref:Uncharacterized protein n=1 Tax=Riccia fluitans TaxID=41844 RepID=A0ABD1YGF9_9MARC
MSEDGHAGREFHTEGIRHSPTRLAAPVSRVEITNALYCFRSLQHRLAVMSLIWRASGNWFSHPRGDITGEAESYKSLHSGRWRNSQWRWVCAPTLRVGLDGRILTPGETSIAAAALDRDLGILKFSELVSPALIQFVEGFVIHLFVALQSFRALLNWDSVANYSSCLRAAAASGFRPDIRIPTRFNSRRKPW